MNFRLQSLMYSFILFEIDFSFLLIQNFQNEAIFEGSELFTVRSGLEHMLHDIRILHDTILQSSHNGRPEVVTKESSGGPGRPRTVISREFLAWAYRFRSTSGIAHFLGVSRTIVRQALLDYNIALPGTNPFPSEDDLDAQPHIPEFVQGSSRDHLPELIQSSVYNATILDLDSPRNDTVFESSSLPGYLSNITDPDLDSVLSGFRNDFPRAGIRILSGMLRNVDLIVSQQRVGESLRRIDPVERIFDRIRLRRRGYRVPGPNSLWHHDGQHGESPAVESYSRININLSFRSHTLGHCYTCFH